MSLSVNQWTGKPLGRDFLRETVIIVTPHFTIHATHGNDILSHFVMIIQNFVKFSLFLTPYNSFF